MDDERNATPQRDLHPFAATAVSFSLGTMLALLREGRVYTESALASVIAGEAGFSPAMIAADRGTITALADELGAFAAALTSLRGRYLGLLTRAAAVASPLEV